MSVRTDVGWVKVMELFHHGVLGMKWGVRRQRSGPQGVTVSRGGLTGKKLKTSGGGGHGPAKQAVKSAKLGQIKKKSGVAALSNSDLEAYAKRMNLEQQVNNLEFNRKNVGQRFVASLMGKGQKQLADAGAKTATKQAGKIISAKMAKKALVVGGTAVIA